MLRNTSWPAAIHQGEVVQRGYIGCGFDHQFHDAAAGQAEAARLVRGDAIALDEGLRAERAGGHAGDQVVLDAAAGHRALHPTVVAQGRPGAGGRGTSPRYGPR